MRRVHDRMGWLACGLLLMVGGCAPNFTSAALGRYEVYEPYAQMRGRAVDLELAQGGYVAVLQVLTPTPGNQDRPVLFRALYPLYETDQREFPAGTHRLLARQQTFRQEWWCGDGQTPSLEGCRRDFRFLPGVRSPNEYRDGRTHYVAIVSDEPIDPYALADELFFAALQDRQFGELLKEIDADVAGSVLERTLLNRPGSANWAAHYVAAR